MIVVRIRIRKRLQTWYNKRQKRSGSAEILQQTTDKQAGVYWWCWCWCWCWLPINWNISGALFIEAETLQDALRQPPRTRLAPRDTQYQFYEVVCASISLAKKACATPNAHGPADNCLPLTSLTSHLSPSTPPLSPIPHLSLPGVPCPARSTVLVTAPLQRQVFLSQHQQQAEQQAAQPLG